MIDFPDIPENVAYVIMENAMILSVLEDFWYLDDFWAEVCRGSQKVAGKEVSMGKFFLIVIFR